MPSSAPSHRASHRATRQPSARQLSARNSAARKGLLLLALCMAVVASAFAVAPSAGGTTVVDASAQRAIAPGGAARAWYDDDDDDRRGHRRHHHHGRASRAERAATTAQRTTTSSGSTAGSATGSASGSTSSAASSSSSGGGATTAPVPPAGPAPSTGDKIFIGAVTSGLDQLVSGTGVQLASHNYGKFENKVPQGDMISVSASSANWRGVANAGPGSALYDNIVRWAQTIKSRGTTVMLNYNHEPEAVDRLTQGSPDDFIAAWRHVVTIFRQQGVTNVVWTWQMTEWAFRAGANSPQYAPKWYPGDEWVDNVGADAYNWISCGETGNGRYNELSVMGDPVVAFARAHGKTASFPEFGAHANSNRAQWLANAHQYLVQNRDIITAAFYFNRAATKAKNMSCQWPLTTGNEFAQVRAMAQDAANFTV